MQSLYKAVLNYIYYDYIRKGEGILVKVEFLP